MTELRSGIHLSSALRMIKNRAFLHELTTHTEGLSVVFFPSSGCKVCGKDFGQSHKAAHNLFIREG